MRYPLEYWRGAMEEYENMCHICNTIQENVVSVQDAIVSANEERAAPRSLRQMLEYCLQLSLDELVFSPQVICFPCVKHLQISYQFIKGFHQVQQVYCMMEERDVNLAELGNEPVLLDNGVLGGEILCDPESLATPPTGVEQEPMVSTEMSILENNHHTPEVSTGCLENAATGQVADDDVIGGGATVASTLFVDDRTTLPPLNSETSLLDMPTTISQENPLSQLNQPGLEMTDVENMENVEYWIIDSKSQYGVRTAPEITATTSVMVNFPSDYQFSESSMPQLECDICSKRFFTQRALQLHLKITHKIRNHDIQ